jgi:hypothetical protein
LVGACKALVVRLKIGIKMSNLILPWSEWRPRNIQQSFGFYSRWLGED